MINTFFFLSFLTELSGEGAEDRVSSVAVAVGAAAAALLGFPISTKELVA